ncbi:MAG: preprotein translocase subunit SecG [Planctomycetota bacterium]|nr:MAG: preprotein translocase subunit SecG [Planctomycetota bacterium]REJ96080.1 MAG: preprotein translocase subunit SecG [Planctomycetota bacterium]REK26105.1 MAG: preprotein translocase subunit SecG [Planctomycetota bacterium]REK27093.1 MAG: preprotein translocase subunit SecG [Planctomycetota bacterium]
MTFLAEFSQVLLFLLGVFLMIVILLQRGRGGGLAGAFGGLGGQSAFGTKAGDVFTKITVVIAVLWVVVSGGSGFFLRAAADAPSQGLQTEEEIEASEMLDDDEPVPGAPGAGPLIPDNSAPPEFPPPDATEDATPDSDADAPDAEAPNAETPDADEAAADSSSADPAEGDPQEAAGNGETENPESNEGTTEPESDSDADPADEPPPENE